MRVLVILLAGKQAGVIVVPALPAANAEPTRNSKCTPDRLGIVGRDGEIRQVVSAECHGTLAPIANRSRNSDRGGRRGHAGRRGGKPVTRRIHDCSARLRHMPDADIAREGTVGANCLATRRRTPAHSKLRAVRHR